MEFTVYKVMSSYSGSIAGVLWPPVGGLFVQGVDSIHFPGFVTYHRQTTGADGSEVGFMSTLFEKADPSTNLNMTMEWHRTVWLPIFVRNVGLKWQRRARKLSRFVHFACCIRHAQASIGHHELSLIFQRM
jgi:hypothetical protein